MDKTQRLEYQRQLESYMEKHQVYDLLQGLLKCLLEDKPKEPLDYLISRLEKSQPKRIFIIGPPGSGKSKIAQELATEFNCSVASMKKIFEKEVTKKTPAGEKIEQARSMSCPIDDETVIQLLLKKLQKHEAKGKNTIVSGFPANVTQALALQSKGIVPNKLFVLSASFEESCEKAINAMRDISEEQNKEEIAKKLVTAYYM